MTQTKKKLLSVLEYRKPDEGPSSADYPDIELVLGIGALTGDISGTMRSLLGLSDEFERQVFSHYKGYDAFSIVPILMRPKSRGKVSLRSKNPTDPPILEANYYERPEDLDTMVRGIKSVGFIFIYYCIVTMKVLDYKSTQECLLMLLKISRVIQLNLNIL